MACSFLDKSRLSTDTGLLRIALASSYIDKANVDLEDVANHLNTNYRVDFWTQIQRDKLIE